MLYDYSGVQNSFQCHLPVKNKKEAFMKISPCGGLISRYVLGCLGAAPKTCVFTSNDFELEVVDLSKWL